MTNRGRTGAFARGAGACSCRGRGLRRVCTLPPISACATPPARGGRAGGRERVPTALLSCTCAVCAVGPAAVRCRWHWRPRLCRRSSRVPRVALACIGVRALPVPLTPLACRCSIAGRRAAAGWRWKRPRPCRSRLCSSGRRSLRRKRMAPRCQRSECNRPPAAHRRSSAARVRREDHARPRARRSARG